MFESVEIREIFKSITQHKLRNALTGFGIAWGIFILILMMGFGDSFQQGIFKLFASYAENTIWVIGGETSLNYKGEAAGKKILFDDEVIAKIKTQFSDIEYTSPEAYAPSTMKITYKENFTVGSLKGVHRDYFHIKKLKLNDGRLFNKNDMERELPICIISENLKKIVFKGSKKTLGEYINIGGNYFKVIGVSKQGNMFDQNDRSTILIPYKYFQSLYNVNTIDYFLLSLHKNANGKLLNKRLSRYIANLYGYNPEDPKAMFTYSLSDEVESFQTLFIGIKIFIWFVGFCILLTGIISVGNIMYVNINERTREIGVRKALGATPSSILKMILTEAIILTSISGLIGMLCGYFVIQLIRLVIEQMANENMLLSHVGTNLPIIIGSFILLIVSGVIAGILPAMKASKIKPVVALNQEN